MIEQDDKDKPQYIEYPNPGWVKAPEIRLWTMVAGQEDKFGRKNDTGKLRMDLIPPEVEEALAQVLTHGAEKYEDRNWEKGIKYSRVYAALRRHLLAWMKGEKTDGEWGLPHLAHAYCCLAFLLTYELRGMGKDWDDLHKEVKNKEVDYDNLYKRIY